MSRLMLRLWWLLNNAHRGKKRSQWDLIAEVVGRIESIVLFNVVVPFQS